MELQIMYPPQKDSPTTFLLGAISATDTFATVGNASLLPQTVPFPLTIGSDTSITETVIVTAIDKAANKITFTRGPSAMPWTSGATVGRVFTAEDLKAVQDNITTIHAAVGSFDNDILNLEGSVGNLETTVGGPSSGLVKGLADEIARAKAAETAETTRAKGIEAGLETNKITRSELPQILTDAAYSADATKLKTTLTRYNASSKVTSTYDRNIPLITSNSVGLMTPEAYNEITALRADVMALQQQGGKFIGISFATRAALNSYVIPASVNLGDFTYVIDDETQQDSTTRYVFNGAKFDFAFVVNYDPVGLATATIAGLVKSITGSTAGKVFVETDGTMSVVGWDALNTVVDGKVDNSRVLTNVPANAKFTDTNTTYTAGAGLTLTGTTFAPDFGTGAGKVVQGNDSRLSDARTPLTHNQAIGTITGLQDALDGKVDNSRVLTDVPTGAKFTDTIFSGDYNDLSNKPTIPDTSTLMPKSGGVLENYTEKIIDASNAYMTNYIDIDLSLACVFKAVPAEPPSDYCTARFLNAKVSGATSFTLIIAYETFVIPIAFPASVKWQGGEIPDLTTANKTYILTFMTINGGTTWYGMFGGEF